MLQRDLNGLSNSFQHLIAQVDSLGDEYCLYHGDSYGARAAELMDSLWETEQKNRGSIAAHR